MQPQLARAALEEHAGRLHRQRRHRIRLRARRIERAGAGETRHADLPLDLGVVRLEIGVGDRPVGEAGAGDRAEHAALDEVDLVKAPEVRRVVQARAADAASVPEGRLELLQLGFLRPASSRNVCGFLTASLVMPPRYQSFSSSCLKVAQREPRSLLQQHDRESCLRQLPRNHAARRAGADDDEVDGLGVPIRLRAHFAFTGSMTKPG